MHTTTDTTILSLVSKTPHLDRDMSTLMRLQQEIITELIKNNPNYKPPPDYRPEKKHRRLKIPVDEYPGYNFIGLIIGPRGNTQASAEGVLSGLVSAVCAGLRVPVLGVRSAGAVMRPLVMVLPRLLQWAPAGCAHATHSPGYLS